MADSDPLLAPMTGTEHVEVGGVHIDWVRAGAGRVRRVVYPPGFRWSVHMKPISGTDLCMHAHVGFLARGRVHLEFADGSVREYQAPQPMVIEPGHDGWVVGDEPAVVIEVDFERNTVSKFELPATHRDGP